MVRSFGWLRASTSTSSGAPPMKMKAPKGAAVIGDPSGTVDLARAAAHQRGGELHTRLGFQLLRIKIHRRTGTIYRVFCTES
jgi:hypothetical protein